jgi:hypothetical protein
MRRMVIGAVLAAALLMPAVGAAAPAKRVPAATSWWQSLGEWIAHVAGLEKTQNTMGPPVSQDPNAPLDARVIIDPNGSEG